jgi:probable rRNA maturation factor
LQELNRNYRGLDKPTDVLSFPQEDYLVLGDVVISVETAARQAQKAHWPLPSELALLGVHGLLHLAGHDDLTEEGAQEMERLTCSLLLRSGIGLPEEDHPFFQNI